jgi:predicted flap endonuclease-1-like 5' DNA nuclease
MVMIEFLREYPLAIVAAVLVIGVLLFLLLRPRQRVTLSDQVPVRPHMAHGDSTKESNDVVAAGAAAATDIGGDIISAPVHAHLTNGPGGLDDFARMKGVGPKFAQLLQARGFTRYEQLAGLSTDEAERLDSELGPFRGRLVRDRVVEQADYLARGDEDGFQQKFGKL